MNKIYRTVYQAATGTWVAASELARGRVKSSKSAVALAVAALGLGLGGNALAASGDACTTTAGVAGTVDASGVCTPASLGTMGSIGIMATGDYAAGGGVIDAGVAGGNNTAIGAGSHIVRDAYGDVSNATALGGATVTNSGVGSVASGAIGIGSGAVVGGNNSIVIGAGASNSNSNAVAIGANSRSAGGGGSVALGASATTTASGGVAVGNNSRITGANSAALGANTGTSRANAFSVGNDVATNADGSARTAFTRQIVNVANGTQATDAVNVSQLSPVVNALGGGASINATTGAVTGPTYTLANGGTQTTVGGALSALDGVLSTKMDNTVIKVGGTTASTVSNNVNNIAIGAGANSSADVASSGSIAFGVNSSSTNAGTVAVGTTANAAGSGAVALGLRSSASGTGSIALGMDSVATANNTVSVGNTTTTQRRIVNMAAGTAGTDAVNVSQLTPVVSALGGGASINATTGAVTGPTYNLANGGTQTTVGGALSALDGAMTTANTNITNNTTAIGGLTTRMGTAEGNISDLQTKIGDGTVGLVQQAGAGANLTVGKGTDGAAVDFTGTAGTRTLTGVTAGALSASSTDVVNGSQLYATNQNVAQNTADIATNTTNISGLTTRMGTAETNITDLQAAVGSGTVGLVQQAGAGANLTVGKGTDGAAVDFTGTAGTRTLTGVTAGTLSASSTEAVNGSQLFATNAQVAQNTSDIATANTNIAKNAGDITTINSQLSSGTIGLVQQATPTGDITVAAGNGGSVVNFAGTAGARTLTGVANGVNDTDAVTLAQLKASGLVDKDGKELGALVYDDLSLKSATLGGTGGTYLNNVAGGLIAAGSMQAVNGGQLFAMQQQYDAQFANLDGRVGAIEKGIEDGSIGGPGVPPGEGGGVAPGTGGPGSIVVGDGADASGKNGSAIGSGAVASGENASAIGNGAAASGSNSSAVGQGAVASGSNSTAVGQGAVASGDNSTALGQGAKATNNNSVALGAGSQTSRDNEVSIGAPGAERYLGNVKDGVLDTDAVNVRQLRGVQNQVDTNRRDAMGGTAAAMAVAGLPQSSMPGRTFMAIAGSTYGGEQGTAVGVSYMSASGRWMVKSAVNTSTRGEVGAVVGGGFYW